jgi:mannitol-1-phosphate 5-dehydrogenase
LRTALQFGAGNIGRGFTGQLFSQSGYEVVFVDVVPEIVEALNRQRSYTITIAAEPEERIRIDNVRAVDGRDTDAVAEEVARCDIACTAVGVNVLGAIAAPLRQGLALRRQRRPEETLNIIICENLRDAAGTLRSLVLEGADTALAEWIDSHVGFVQAVVGRMVPVRTPEEKAADLLGIRVEPFCRLPIDADAIRGGFAPIEGVIPRSNFQAYIDQKLFAHNAGHAAAAYFGALRGLTYLWECMEDPEVRAKTEAVMTETGRALIARYGLDAQEHWAHVNDLLHRFSNRRLGDTVARVGSDPIRKLGREDRLVGAALFCLEQHVRPENVARAIAAGLRFRNPDDPSAVRLQNLIEEKGIEAVVEEVCGVRPDSEAGRMILQAYGGET